MRKADLQSESGYSLLEVLVALVILLIVLIPAGQWLGKLLIDRTVSDKLVALQLAEEAMEDILISKAFRSDTKELTYAKQKLRLKTFIQERRENLLLISVEVSKKEKALTRLQRSHFQVAESIPNLSLE